MEILQDVLDKVHVAHLAAFLLHRVQVAEFAEGGVPRRFRLHSLREVLLDQRLKMKLDFFVELAFSLFPAKERAQTER